MGRIVLRLGAAAGAGMLLGVNRDLQNKPIGTRTLGLVSLGTALVAVSAIQFPGMAENPDAASRVVQGLIQGVMAGISFIGAGAVLRDARAQMAYPLCISRRCDARMGRAPCRWPWVSWREWEGIEIMSTENAAGNQTYMIVAALLMVGLLTFGVMHSFGVFR